MRADSIQLTGGSLDAQDASSTIGLKFPVTSLPATPSDGLVYVLTAQDGSNAPGLYFSRGGQWYEATGGIFDANGKLLPSLIPSLAITDTFVVSSQAQMLALTAQTGDIAIRTDSNTTYILQGSDPTVLSNWIALAASNSYILPKASTSVLGGVKLNSDFSIDANGVLSLAQLDAGTY
jgi:hypothetical protein